MQIQSVSLKGFRNLATLELNFQSSAPIIAFIGSNAQGKTNLLESIYLCALSKSFRTKKNTELIGFGQEFCTIKVALEEMNLEVILTSQPSKKALKVNGVKKNAPEFIGQLKAVFFSPDDLSNMAFSPKLRRRYLNVMSSQMQPERLEELMHYESLKKQRNALLKEIRRGKKAQDQLLFWNEKLAHYGLRIIQARKVLLKDLEPHLQKHYQSISQSEEVVELGYHSELEGCLEVDEYLRRLKEMVAVDIAAGKTCLGPHRDDLVFKLKGKDMQAFSSRGEWRSMVLALKFAELELIESSSNQKPILLLDDVFSELDQARQKYLVKAVEGYQSFITTTHREFVDHLYGNKTLYEVKNGEVFEL